MLSACSELAWPAALCCAGAEASRGVVAHSSGGKWPVGAAQVGSASSELCSWCSWPSSAVRRGRKEKEKRKEKRKSEKGKERKEKRGAPAGFAAAVASTRCGVRPVSDEHAE